MYVRITHLFSLTTLALVSQCLSQDIGIGPCPKPKFQKDLDMKRFSGKWYQIERYQGNYLTTRTIKCNVVTFVPIDKRTVGINSTFISTVQVGDKSVQSTYNTFWRANIADEKVPAKMTVQVQIAPNESYYGDGSNLQMNYWVLDTGYESNALLWTCTSNGYLFTQYAEIMHRTDSLSQDVLDEIHRGLYPYLLRPEYFRSVKHDQKLDCDY